SLNFLQHLSGIATQTQRYVEATAGVRCKILDTRKTTPGWRLLEKYAVRCGGGHNHRAGLYDGILVKDNHLVGLPIAGCRARMQEAVRRARNSAPPKTVIEIEVETLDQLDAALAALPDIVLLDNMSANQLREAVAHRNRVATTIQLEASGGISLTSIRQ